MTFRFSVRTFRNQLPVIRGNLELPNMLTSPSGGLLKSAGWGEANSMARRQESCYVMNAATKKTSTLTHMNQHQWEKLPHKYIASAK